MDFLHHGKDCPTEKLKLFSYNGTVQLSKPLYPITPERNNKQIWIMDAWETEIQESKINTPGKKMSRRVMEDFSTKNIRIKKIGENKKEDSSLLQDKYYTPRQDKESESNEKQNKYRFRIHHKTLKRENGFPLESVTSYKIPIESIVYPVAKNSSRGKSRRIDRFHSFVARNIRK